MNHVRFKRQSGAINDSSINPYLSCVLTSRNFHFQNEKCLVIFIFEFDIVRSNRVSVNQTRNDGRYDMEIQSEVAEMEMRHFVWEFVRFHKKIRVLREITSIRCFDGIFRIYENSLILREIRQSDDFTRNYKSRWFGEKSFNALISRYFSVFKRFDENFGFTRKSKMQMYWFDEKLLDSFNLTRNLTFN